MDMDNGVGMDCGNRGRARQRRTKGEKWDNHNRINKNSKKKGRREGRKGEREKEIALVQRVLAGIWVWDIYKTPEIVLKCDNMCLCFPRGRSVLFQQFIKCCVTTSCPSSYLSSAKHIMILVQE